MVYGWTQFIFEFLFDCLEELNVVSAGEQPAQEIRLVLVDFLSVSPPIVAFKHVREGWVWVLVLSLPLRRKLLISKQPLPKEAEGLIPGERNPNQSNQASASSKCRLSLPGGAW